MFDLRTQDREPWESAFNHTWADPHQQSHSPSLPLAFAPVSPAKTGVTPATLWLFAFNVQPSKKPDPKSSEVNGQAHADVSEVPG